MNKFYDVFDDGTATVSFYPSANALNDLGYDNVFDMCEDLEDTVKSNYPELYEEDECQFDPESSGFMVYCNCKDVAEVVNEELVYLIEYREYQMGQVNKFE